MELCDIPVRFPALPANQCRNSRRRSPIPPCLALSSWSASVSRRPGSESEDQRRLFVFGMGFVGRYVADRLKREEGWTVSGTCTSAIKKKELEEMGYDAFIFNTSEDIFEDLSTLQFATHLLVSIPPIVGIGDPLLCLREDLQNMLSYRNLQWTCYLSSTSVYGECGGALVDEDYAANPITASAKARLDAEQGWLDLGHDLGASVYVFRLGGIYGPGRSALDTIIKEEPLSKYQRMRESRRYTVRVHVADIYQAIKASFNRASSGEVYNVVDDDPAPRAEVFAFARNLMKEKWPGQIKVDMSFDAEDSVIQEENGRGEKRVSNARLKRELGVSLIHPSFRSGLQSILNSCRNPTIIR